MPKKKRTSRKPKISCKRKYGMETCRIKRCNLKNIDIQIGDPYRILNLTRHTIKSVHFYAEITNPRKNCVYVFGLTRGTGVGFRGNGAALMIHDARLSKVSKDNGLKTGEILTKKDISKIMGEETGEIDQAQKKIIDIFNERSIIYKVKGKNHARIAYLDVPFDLLKICFADLPGNYTYQIREPPTVNCRKGAVLFHYQPYMLLNMVDEHLVNHNEQAPDFKSIAEQARSLPEYEYSPELVSSQLSQLSQPSLSSSSNQPYYLAPPIPPSLSNQQYYSANSNPLSLGSSYGLDRLYSQPPVFSPVVRERIPRIRVSPDPFSPVTSPV